MLGLLILRLALGGSLFADAALALPQSASSPTAILAGAAAVTGVFLVVGLWTPVAGLAVCLLELATALFVGQAAEPRLVRAAIGLGLALLGPGALSIDARRFGRRRVEIKQLRDDD